MSLSLFRASRFVLGLTFLFSTYTNAFSQYDEMADVDADSAATAQLVSKSPYVVKPVTDREITERLGQMSSCMDLRNTRVVKSYIMHYLYRPEKTKKILSRMVMYFPMFEQKLREYEVPDALKYLSVVESALNANAVSRVGASGLWQFMPATGLDYNMQINSAIDERNNVVKSTEGAAKYLKHLHAKYNDWALALAAYNSGPNRVDGAIRRAGSRNFWVLQRFLPEETRNYVPAFIAATYICNFYNEHNLNPDYPELDLQLTDHVTVYDGISFSAIAKATGLSYSAVADLNPGFRRSYIPPSKRGYYLTLPKRVMPAMVRHLNTLGGNTYQLDGSKYSNDAGSEPASGANQYHYTTITVNETDLADNYASRIGASGIQLRVWNQLANPYVYANQTLKIWHPVHVIKHIGGIDVANLNKNEVPAAPVKIDPKAKANPTGAKPTATAAAKPAAPSTVTKPNANGGSTTVTTFTRPASQASIQANANKPATKPIVVSTGNAVVANTSTTPSKPVATPTATASKPTTTPTTTTAATKPAATTTAKPTATTTTAAKPTTAAATTTIVKPGTPATPAAANGTQYLFHKVKGNETLADLARRYNVAEDKLMLLNNTSTLKEGMLIKIKELK
jgi:membrane-bound lytic murein transglycosylase D